MPKDLLRIADLSGEQLRRVLDVAGDLAQHPTEMQHELAGELVVLYLTEASTRTRVTFAHAAARVGATVVVVGPGEMAGRGGTLDDIAEAVSGYAGAIVARAGDADLERLATAATVPVINGLSDRHQPVQALADLLTLRATFGSLDDRRIAYIGDGTSVCHSLIEACAITGIDLRLVCPPGRAPDAEVLARAGALTARASADATGPTVTYDAAEAVDGVDALYLGPWLAGALPDDERAAVPSYPVTRDLLDRAAPQVIVLHSHSRSWPPAMPSPSARASGVIKPRAPWSSRVSGGEADTGQQAVLMEVLRDPRSRGRAQAENRRHAAAALLVALRRDGIAPTVALATA